MDRQRPRTGECGGAGNGRSARTGSARAGFHLQAALPGYTRRQKPGRSGAPPYPAGPGGGWRQPKPRRRGARYRSRHTASQVEALRLEPRYGRKQELKRELPFMNLVHLLPVGTIDLAVLEDLCAAIPKRLNVNCKISPFTLDPAPTYHPERQQFHSSEILQRMYSLLQPRDWRLLAVTDLHLDISISTSGFREV